MQHHVVVGAGPVGSGIAAHLAATGTPVTLISRSGRGPADPLITLIAADAADAEALVQHAKGSAALYNCANPAYHRWATDWPPIHQSLMAAAANSDAVLVMMDNLYAFGTGAEMPMSESQRMNATGTKGKMRATMAREILEAHASGRLRATLARASDFFGPEVLGAAFGDRLLPKVLAGKSVSVLGQLDVPHSVSYMPDVVQTLVTLARDDRAWGKPWHVPNSPAVTQRQIVDAFCGAAGTKVKIRTIPRSALTALGVFVPMIRELKETYYQFDLPWVTNSSLTEQTFGLTATPLAQAAEATVAWWRAR